MNWIQINRREYLRLARRQIELARRSTEAARDNWRSADERQQWALEARCAIGRARRLRAIAKAPIDDDQPYYLEPPQPSAFERTPRCWDGAVVSTEPSGSGGMKP